MIVLFVHWFRIEAIAFVELLKMANFLLWYLDMVGMFKFGGQDGRVLVALDFCG